MRSIVDTMNALAINSKKAQSYLKWHPNPEPDPKCDMCGKVFKAKLHRVEGSKMVVVSAKARKQIHDMAYTYQGNAGMCGLGEDARRRILRDA